jgi:hypothetical protein
MRRDGHTCKNTCVSITGSGKNSGTKKRRKFSVVEHKLELLECLRFLFLFLFLFLVVTKNRISNNYLNFNLCLQFYFFVFISILCFIRQKTVFFFIHIFFIRDNSPCRVKKAKEQPPPINVLMLFLLSKHRKKYFLSMGLLNTMLHQEFCIVFFIYNCYVCFNGNKFTKFLICLLLL